MISGGCVCLTFYARLRTSIGFNQDGASRLLYMAGLQFNGDANGLDICTLADNMINTNVNNFPLTQKTVYANMAMREIWGDVFSAYGGWVFDDSNLTDLPIATADLVANQQFYALPITNLSHIVALEFQNVGGTWIPLSPITIEKIHDNGYADSEFLKTAAVPMFYRPLATGLRLYPPANFSQSQSLRVHFSRDISTFVPTDTTKVPGFDPLYHEGVSIFIALKYAQAKGLSVAGGVMRGGWKTGLLADWFDFETRLTKHYSERFKQMFPPRIHVQDATRVYQ